MFVSFMKISACWLLHRLIKFNKICWERRPAKPQPSLRTSFCRRDLTNTQPHLNVSFLLRKVENVTTISKSQSLTSVSIRDCTLRVPNDTTALFLVRVIVKAIFIQKRGGKRKKKEGGGWVQGGRGAWVLRRVGPYTNNTRSTWMFFSFSSPAKGQTKQTTPLTMWS